MATENQTKDIFTRSQLNRHPMPLGGASQSVHWGAPFFKNSICRIFFARLGTQPGANDFRRCFFFELFEDLNSHPEMHKLFAPFQNCVPFKFVHLLLHDRSFSPCWTAKRHKSMNDLGLFWFDFSFFFSVLLLQRALLIRWIELLRVRSAGLLKIILKLQLLMHWNQQTWKRASDLHILIFHREIYQKRGAPRWFHWGAVNSLGGGLSTCSLGGG